MVTMTLTLEDARLDAALAEGIRAAGDMTPLMRRIGAVLETSVSERFEQSKGPGGEAWPVSIRAREEGGQTLIDSARLRDNIVSEAEPRAVEIGTNVPYAATHQFGATIRPREAGSLAFRLPGGQFVTVGKVNIPARPFLGFDAADEADIGDTVEAYFREALT